MSLRERPGIAHEMRACGASYYQHLFWHILETFDDLGESSVPPNTRMQLTAASVTLAAGHPARWPAEDDGRGRS